MKLDARTRLLLRLQNWLFVVLFGAVLGLLGWLSIQHDFEFDLTAGARNTLTPESQLVLAGITGPVTLTAFVRADEARRRSMETVVERYQRFKADVSLEFVNPDTAPDRARAAGVTGAGEVVVGYEGRSERLAVLNERTLTNALVRLGREDERWMVFMAGHGERNPQGEANHDLGLFGAELERQGIRVRAFNPLAQGPLPANASAVVVSTPAAQMLPGAAEAVVAFVEAGGNLLWLHDPGPLNGLEPLADLLGLAFPDGVMVDTTAQMFGVEDPRVILVAEYTQHAATGGLDMMTLFPVVTTVDYEQVPEPWRVDALLTSLPNSWQETGAISGRIEFEEDTGDLPGPLDIGITLTRIHEEDEQRVVIIGDGDFISNSFIGNGANMDLGLKLFNWLAGDDPQVAVHLRGAPDITLELDNRTYYAISVLFLIGLPLLLVGTGITVWLRRRRR